MKKTLLMFSILFSMMFAAPAFGTSMDSSTENQGTGTSVDPSTDVSDPEEMEAAEEIDGEADIGEIELEEYDLEFISEDVDDLFGKAENIGDQTEEGYELVWTDGSRKIFKNLDNSLYEDINGTVSDKELVELGIIAEEDAYIGLDQPVPITLDVSVDFENFEMEDSIIHNITVTAYGEERYEGESVFQPDFVSINLSRENGFTNSQTFDCTDPNFFIKAEIENDFSNAYRISILNDGDERVMFSSDQSSYSIVISVYKPEHTITDTNLVESNPNWDYYASGEYAESRAEKSGYEITDDDGETASRAAVEVPEDPVEKKTNLFAVVIVTVLLALVIGACGVIYILWRRANEDD